MKGTVLYPAGVSERRSLSHPDTHTHTHTHTLCNPIAHALRINKIEVLSSLALLEVIPGSCEFLLRYSDVGRETAKLTEGEAAPP